MGTLNEIGNQNGCFIPIIVVDRETNNTSNFLYHVHIDNTSRHIVWYGLNSPDLLFVNVSNKRQTVKSVPSRPVKKTRTTPTE